MEIIHRRKSCASMVWLRKDTSDRVAWINPRHAAVIPRLSFSSFLFLFAHEGCPTCLLDLSVTRRSGAVAYGATFRWWDAQQAPDYKSAESLNHAALKAGIDTISTRDSGTMVLNSLNIEKD